MIAGLREHTGFTDKTYDLFAFEMMCYNSFTVKHLEANVSLYKTIDPIISMTDENYQKSIITLQDKILERFHYI